MLRSIFCCARASVYLQNRVSEYVSLCEIYIRPHSSTFLPFLGQMYTELGTGQN